MSEDDDPKTGQYQTEHTRVHSRTNFYIRNEAGNSYGPFSKEAILNLIQSGRLRGKEDIMREGGEDWKPLVSDPDFYDAVMLFRSQDKNNRSPKDKGSSGKKKSSRQDSSTHAEPQGGTQTFQGKRSLTNVKGALSDGQGDGSYVDKLVEVAQPKRSLKSSVSGGGSKRLRGAGTQDFKIPALILGLVVVAAFVFLDPYGLLHKNQATVQNTEKNSELAYHRPLQRWLGRLLNLPLQPQPSDRIVFENHWPEFQSFRGDEWAIELEEALVQAQKTQNAAQWGRFVWSAWNLSELTKGIFPDFSQRSGIAAKKVLDALKKQDVLPEYPSRVLATVPDWHTGNWQTVVEQLKGLESRLTAGLLIQDAQWALWWKGQQGDVLASLPTTPFRYGLVRDLRNAATHFRSRLDQLASYVAVEDPLSSDLWLIAGNGVWTMNPKEFPLANRFFVVGMGTLSLYPRSVQSNYWNRYVQFLSALGRGQASERARTNESILERWNSESRASWQGWWDLTDSDLGIEKIIEQTRAELDARGPQAPLVATIEVLSPIVDSARSQLIGVADFHALNGDWRRALTIYDRILEINSNDKTARSRRVWVYAMQRRFDSAYEDIDHLGINFDQRDLWEGVIHLEGADPKTAMDLFKRYGQKAPNDPWGLFFLARLYRQIQDPISCAKSAALGEISSAGKLKNSLIRLRLLCQIEARANVDTSLLGLERAVQDRPNELATFFDWIEGLEKTSAWNRAEKELREKLQQLDRHPEVLIRLSDFLMGRKKIDEAVTLLEEAVKQPRGEQAYFKIGEVFAARRKWVEAARAFEKFAMERPWEPDSWLRAARAYRQAGRRDDAVRTYLREMKERPAIISTFIETGQYLLEIGSAAQVDTLFEMFSPAYQGDPSVNTVVAQAALAQKQWDKARNHAALALAQNPGNPEANRVMGMVLHESGQYPSAKEHLQRYLRARPEAPDRDEIQTMLSRFPYE